MAKGSTRQAGATAEPPNRAITGSTLSETPASCQGVGSGGNGTHAGNAPSALCGSLRWTGSDHELGQPSQTIDFKPGRGTRVAGGFIRREKITTSTTSAFPRHRHARGAAAHGLFECYQSWRVRRRRSGGRQAHPVRALLAVRGGRLHRHPARRGGSPQSSIRTRDCIVATTSRSSSSRTP